MIRPLPVRAAILDALLADPEAEWTIRSLAEALDQAGQVHHQVPELVALLMHERLLGPVPYQRYLTVRVRNGAETAIRFLRCEWRTSH
ncbi:hypothetical protein GCM10010432_63980 [Catellatospora methionotrophica]